MNKNVKSTILGVVCFFTVKKLFSMSKSKKTIQFFPVNQTNNVRLCDPFGCGYFGAPRAKGKRKHRGLDFKVSEDDSILAPFDCKLVRYGYPYPNDKKQLLIVIQGIGLYKDYKAKIMYIKPLLNEGGIVARGGVLCKAGNISKKYSKLMTNHVHFELYKNEKLINPEPFFKNLLK